MKRFCSSLLAMAAALCSTLVGCHDRGKSNRSQDDPPDPNIRWTGQDSQYRGTTSSGPDGKARNTATP